MGFSASQRIVESLPIAALVVGKAATIATNASVEGDTFGRRTGSAANTGVDLYAHHGHRWLVELYAPSNTGKYTVGLQWAVGSYDLTDGTATVDSTDFVGLSKVDGTVSTLIEATVNQTNAAGKAFVQQLEIDSIHLKKAVSTSASRRAYLRVLLNAKVKSLSSPIAVLRYEPRYTPQDEPSWVKTPVVAHDL